MKPALIGAGLLVLANAGCGPCPCKVEHAAAPNGGYHAPSYTSGFFKASMQGGRAWLIAPDGERFLSQGVNAIIDASYNAPNQNYYDPAKHQFAGDKGAWVSSAFGRLASWGFNTVGSWSDDAFNFQHYPYTYMLYAAGFDQPLEHVFDPVFESRVAANTEKAAAHKDDPYLVGYFLDNELPWWGEFGWHAGGQKSLLEKYAHAEAGGGGKRVLREFLERRYKDIAALNRAYRSSLKSFAELEQSVDLPLKSRAERQDSDDFAGVVADRFFAVTTKALRAKDPNHLNLCVRFAGEAPWPVVEAAAKYCDVVSVNQYAQSGDVNQSLLDDFYVKTQKPILITEYSFSAAENQSGDPNTKGASVTVPTQRERAEHTTHFATQALALPYVVGMHWFEWADESPQGRFDGEDQNYGLVDIQDRPYALVTQAHAALNARAVEIHGASTTALPTVFQGTKSASLREPTRAKPLSAPLTFFLPANQQQIVDWADAPNGGSAKVEKKPASALIRFDAGGGWGAGVSVLAAHAPFDALGAQKLEVVLSAPADKTVQMFVTEVGVAAPQSPHFAGQNGSDGESYEFPPLVGTGKRETYVIDLHDLERRSSWGNQHGNQVLDMQAVAQVDLSIPGKQGTGEIELYSITFK